MVELSIIIANWNGKTLLADCLKSVKEHTNSISYEIIIVDNGSNDRSVEFIKGRYPDAIVICNSKNEGYAKANNQGIRASKGKYVLLLNNDTKILPEAINILLEFIKAKQDAGCVSAQLLNKDLTIQKHCRRFPSLDVLMRIHTALGYKFKDNITVNRYFMMEWAETNSGVVDQPSAVCLLVKREVFNNVGLLNEKYFLLYNDVDLCKRIKVAGYKVYLCATAKVIHLGSISTKMYDDYIVEKYSNLFEFIRNEYGIAILSIFKVFFAGTLIISYLKKDQLHNEIPGLLKLLLKV